MSEKEAETKGSHQIKTNMEEVAALGSKICRDILRLFIVKNCS
jgi:hypothetical protein